MLILAAYAAIGRFFVNRWMMPRLFYALTNHRVIRYFDGPFGALKTHPLDNLPYLELSVRRDGSGTILFELNDDGFWFQNWRNLTPEPLLAGFKFHDIDDVQSVYAQIENEIARQ